MCQPRSNVIIKGNPEDAARRTQQKTTGSPRAHRAAETSGPPFSPAQPGTLSNVENGYGFWGSIGYYVQEWETSFEFSWLLGYKGVPCDHETCSR